MTLGTNFSALSLFGNLYARFGYLFGLLLLVIVIAAGFIASANENSTNIDAEKNYIPITSWEIPAPTQYAPSYIDNFVAHNGHASIRQDGMINGGTYYVREVNRLWSVSPELSIQAGDIVTISAWIKCASSTVGMTSSNIENFVHCGAWLGCDFWAKSTSTSNTALDGWIDGVAYGCTGGVPLDVDHVTIQQVHDWMVPMGSDWTYRTMTFTVPTGAWGTSEQAYSQIAGMSVWFGCYVSDSNDNKLQEMGSIWISEPVLTIIHN